MFSILVWIKTHLLAFFTVSKTVELLVDKTCDIMFGTVTEKIRNGRERRAVKKVYKETMKEFKNDSSIYDKDAEYCSARFNYVKTHPAAQEMIFASYPELGAFMRRFYENLKNNDETLRIIGEYSIASIYEYVSDTNRMARQLLENSIPNAGAALKDNINAMSEAIESLKLKTATRILDKMEESLNQYPEMQQQKAVYATLYFLKGFALEFTNPSKALENYKRAYSYNPYLPHLKERYLATLFVMDQIENGGQQLVEDLLREDENNVTAIAVKALALLGDPVIALRNVDKNIKEDYRFKWLVMGWLHYQNRDRIKEIEEVVPMTYGIVPSELTANNFAEWMYMLNAILNQFIRTDEVDIYGNTFVHPEHSVQFDSISKFYELAETTEVKNSFISVKAYFLYLNFREKKDNDALGKLLAIKEDDEVIVRCKFSALMFHDEYGKAYDVLSEKYQPYSARHKIYAALKMGDAEKIRASIINMAGNYPLATLDILTIFECIKLNRELLGEEEFISALRNANYEQEEGKSIAFLYLDAIGGERDNKILDNLLQSLNGISYAIACRLWADTADLEYAWNRMQGHFSADDLGKRTETLLYLDILYRINSHNEEFCKLSKEFREKYGFLSIQYLMKEANCYCAILDYASAIEPHEILFEIFADNEAFAGNYAMILVKTNSYEKIKSHIHAFTRISYTSTICIKNVFYALTAVKAYDEALAFIYPYAKDEAFAEIGDFYIMIAFEDKELAKILHEVMPEVKEGYAVQLTREAENITTEAHENSEKTSLLLGHKVGDVITFNQKDYTITNIGSKYLALSFLLKERMGTPGNIYVTQTFSVNENEDPGELLKKIEALLPKNGYTKKDFENDVEAYEKRDHSLYYFMTNDVVFSCVQLILSDFRKAVFPYQQISIALEGYKQQNIEITDFVLDPLSVVLLAYLTKKRGYAYKRKFLIPKSEKELFEQSLNNYLRYPNNVNPINFWGLVPMSMDMTLGKDYKEVLEYLNGWIEGNCKVEFVKERMAEPNGLKLKVISLEVLVDCLMLSSHQYNMLITEDAAIYSLLKGIPFAAICSETYLHYYEGRGIEVSEDLLERNYVVSILDAEILFTEYDKRVKSDSNRYDTCQKVMSEHPEFWQVVLQFISMILNKDLLLPQDIIEVKQLLVNLIRPLRDKRKLLLQHFMNNHLYEIKLQKQFSQLFNEACLQVDIQNGLI